MSDRPEDWRVIWNGLNKALGRKWGVHVLRVLADRPHRFNELHRAIDGPTSKTLSARLNELRCAGLVDRQIDATSPPSTRYSLTSAGERFVDVLCGLEREVAVVRGCCDENCEMITVDPARTAEVVAEGC